MVEDQLLKVLDAVIEREHARSVGLYDLDDLLSQLCNVLEVFAGLTLCFNKRIIFVVARSRAG